MEGRVINIEITTFFLSFTSDRVPMLGLDSRGSVPDCGRDDFIGPLVSEITHQPSH
jgi:hypothetical protein